jgi:RES domain-containing protein
VQVYRLCRAAFKTLDGEGARLYGGRWNSPGRSVVYTSTSLALAALEYLVHVEADTAPADLTALVIDVPDDFLREEIAASVLPTEWAHTVVTPETQALGDAWAEAARSAILMVPSAPVPEEWNVLINVQHPEARRCTIVRERPFVYDPRLVG